MSYAETEAEARRLATSRNLAKLKTALGQRGGVPSVETALAYRYSPQELAYIAEFSRSYIDGNPQQVKAGLEAMAEQYKHYRHQYRDDLLWVCRAGAFV